MSSNSNIMTDDIGRKISDNQHSLTVGPDGPILLQDFNLINKIAHFDRERIPERVVHAKGAAAHGYFEVTHDISKYTKAKFLNEIGKKLQYLHVSQLLVVVLILYVIHVVLR